MLKIVSSGFSSAAREAFCREIKKIHALGRKSILIVPEQQAFISESMLPELCAAGGAPLQVGKMAYDTIIVPGCLSHPLQAFDPLAERIRKAVTRNKELTLSIETLSDNR